MFNSAQEFIDFIITRKTTSDNRAGFRALLDSLGHPERQLKCLHVAGTNGKGSTTDYLRSILQQHGYKVGSFTSPHLIVHNDRIRINNQFISDEDLLAYGNRFREYYDQYDLSMFQIDMLISIYYFLENKVD
ncbi:MAG: bifunctional folylpolyglutamate synthase/dihydrofolate synthase, partial [Erysipelotrichaceae bacterium]|nr:bifunctional folylpolyglutamate synthase/dihydrofolate synthase [Erysipelotrichaceae bacterium]